MLFTSGSEWNRITSCTFSYARTAPSLAQTKNHPTKSSTYIAQRKTYAFPDTTSRKRTWINTQFFSTAFIPRMPLTWNMLLGQRKTTRFCASEINVGMALRLHRYSHKSGPTSHAMVGEQHGPFSIAHGFERRRSHCSGNRISISCHSFSTALQGKLQSKKFRKSDTFGSIGVTA